MFSSAFVVLARSVGIPARVVSGWAIGETDDEQTVFSDQAHQWAEVALDGIGWVTFEPTPAGGAPSRTTDFYPSEYEEDVSIETNEPEENEVEDAPSIPESELQGITDEIDDALNILGEDSGTGIFRLQQVLENTQPGYREAVLEILEERGASVTGIGERRRTRDIRESRLLGPRDDNFPSSRPGQESNLSCPRRRPYGVSANRNWRRVSERRMESPVSGGILGLPRSERSNDSKRRDG